MNDERDLERAAETWIQPYTDAHHLRRTREWALGLQPAAPLAVRLAALTHDMERHFPGGPRMVEVADIGIFIAWGQVPAHG